VIRYIVNLEPGWKGEPRIAQMTQMKIAERTHARSARRFKRSAEGANFLKKVT
jgi:hypothetical protein